MVHGLDIGQHQRRHALRVVFDDGLAHVVAKGALAVRGVAQARDQADVVECQLPIMLGQAGLADAVEGAAAMLVVALAQHAQAHALHDGVGEDGAAALLQVVGGDVGQVDDLVPHAGLLVLIRQHGVDQVVEHLADLVLLGRHRRRHELPGIDERHGKPTLGTQPEVGRKAGDRIAPELLAARVVGVIVQTVERVAHQVVHDLEHMEAVRTGATVVEAQLVLHVERLGHVHAVEPNLVGVDGLVPKHALFGARLGLELTVNGVHGGTVFGLAHQAIQLIEGLARVYVVEVVLLGLVMLDGAVFLDKEVDVVVGKRQIALLTRNLVQLDERLDHAAIDVVPGVLLAGTELFDVPSGCLRRRCLDQLLDVAIQNLIATHCCPL